MQPEPKLGDNPTDVGTQGVPVPLVPVSSSRNPYVIVSFCMVNPWGPFSFCFPYPEVNPDPDVDAALKQC